MCRDRLSVHSWPNTFLQKVGERSGLYFADCSGGLALVRNPIPTFVIAQRSDFCIRLRAASGWASDLGLGGHGPGLASLIHQSIGVDKGDKQVEGGQAIRMKERAKSRY
jgi:hypothetical protein